MQNWLVVSTLLFCIAQSPQLLGEDSPPKPSIANENEDSTMRLSDAEMVVAPAGFIDSLAPYKCDADGGIYLRKHELSATSGWRQVIKLNAKGEPARTFTVPSDLHARDFFVDADGHLFVMADQWKEPADRKAKFQPPDVYILRYYSDGNLDTKTRLDTSFMASGSFLVFPDGNILVSALELDPVPRRYPSSDPFTALFDSRGQLLKKISLADDKWITEAAERNVKQQIAAANGGNEETGAAKPGEEKSTKPEKRIGEGAGANPAVALGQALIGSDGNAYILRRTLPAIVYVISSAGILVRTLTLKPADPPQFPGVMLESRGRLAIFFRDYGPGEGHMKIFDSHTGTDLQTFKVDPLLGVTISCFKAPQFTFVSEKEKKMVFYFVRPPAP